MLVLKRALAPALALLLLLPGTGCGQRAQQSQPPRPQLPPMCATEFMTAFVNADATWMYACSSGRLKHALDERADATRATPKAVLENDLAARAFKPTGKYRLVALGDPGAKYRLVDLVSTAHYNVETDRGPMRVTLFLDSRGLVGKVAGPYPLGS